MNFDDMKLSVEAMTGGKNTVVLDDKGLPSIMVRIPKTFLDEIDVDAAHSLHAAFIKNGVEQEFFYASKYQNMVMNDRAYSLPFKDPRTAVTYDQAHLYSNNKGEGWHLMTNAEWSLMALWSKKNGTMPRGNNDYGRDYAATYEKGTLINGDKVATGSGPVSWAHDNSNAGVFDLNGNVREWVGGLRLVDGEIQVVENNDAADNTISHAADSTAWKAISATDGSLLSPGSTDTLKYDATSPIDIATSITTVGTSYNSFETVTANGITVPNVAKELAIAPLDANHGGDRLYINNEGERLPYRGGYWNDGSDAGVFNLYLYTGRSNSGSNLGFRAAFL